MNSGSGSAKQFGFRFLKNLKSISQSAGMFGFCIQVLEGWRPESIEHILQYKQLRILWRVCVAMFVFIKAKDYLKKVSSKPKPDLHKVFSAVNPEGRMTSFSLNLVKLHL